MSLIIKIECENPEILGLTNQDICWSAEDYPFLNGIKFLKMTFVGISRIDGSLILRIGDGYIWNAGLMSKDPSISVADVFNQHNIIFKDFDMSTKLSPYCLHPPKPKDFIRCNKGAQLVKALEDTINPFSKERLSQEEYLKTTEGRLNKMSKIEEMFCLKYA